MKRNLSTAPFKTAVISLIFCMAAMPLVFADIIINVMAVNGADAPKNTTVKFNLPGELAAGDILDTNGLQLDYNVNDANYYVHGALDLQPKESKTFRVRVKDVWRISPQQVTGIKQQIDEGYASLGKDRNAQKADILKTRLTAKLDYIIDSQNIKADSVEKRMSSYRTYAKEIKRIQNDALAVEYWRSDPGQDVAPKIIYLVIEVENPLSNPTKMVKQKHYLPAEVKPEYVVEDQGFEVRFDQRKQRPFLFKEEEMTSGQKKKYSIGILDMWFIAQKDMDYLRSRAHDAYDFLKDSEFMESAKRLVDRISAALSGIEVSQAQQRPIEDHIGAYRINQKTYADAQKDVETLEKLLSLVREDLEKSKVENVLRKIRSLKDLSSISATIFGKKFEMNTAWIFIGWVLAFVGTLTLFNYAIWVIRSKEKKKKQDEQKK